MAASRSTSVPVLPTLLTAGNLACGVTAILCAASDHGLLFQGAVLVFAAMVFDMFDGKVARMTGTDGEFGAQLDSLSDVVSFGVAPAMLVHRAVLGENPGMVWGEGERLIWLLTVFYAVLTAIRLARYNVEHDEEATRDFKGLPSPGAAAMLCSWVMLEAWLMASDSSTGLLNYHTSILAHIGLPIEVWNAMVRLVLMSGMVLSGLLMISTMRFPHIGNTVLGGKQGLRSVILLLLGAGLVVIEPLYTLTAVTTGYILYGLIPGIIRGCRRWTAGRDLLEADEDDEDEASTGTPEQPDTKPAATPADS